MSGRPDPELRKGWCPGALRPMMARDGLLVRLKITGGIVPAGLARAIADLAERDGNGLLDLSARANLQLRGVREASLPALLDGLRALGLLDGDPAAEAVRNVLCSPMAGYPPPRSGRGGPREAWGRGGRQLPPSQTTCSLADSKTDAWTLPPPPSAGPLSGGAEEDTRPDIRPLAAALENALASTSAFHALPPKFGVLLDDGGTPSLAGEPADLRFAWAGDAFAIGLGGTAATALDLGRVATEEVVARAHAILHRLLALPGDARRPLSLVKDGGRAALAAWFDASPPPADSACPARPRVEAPLIVGLRTFAGLPVLGLAAPFGRFDAAMLRAAADACVDELRLTPWRTILLPGIRAAVVPGFILDPADPRLRVAACTGMSGCERGSTDTHADAARFAPLAAALPGEGVTLHVSGCAKGCARPARTAITLVGRDGRYDLVRDGRPGDQPFRDGLDRAGIRDALVAA